MTPKRHRNIAADIKSSTHSGTPARQHCGALPARSSITAQPLASRSSRDSGISIRSGWALPGC